MPRVLLLLPTTSYRTPDFLEAAARVGAEVVVGSEQPSTLEALNPEGLLTLDFRDPAACAARVAAFANAWPVQAVLGVDEDTAVAAAAIARELGLSHNSVEGVRAARNKAVMRRMLDDAGVPVPRHRLLTLDENPGRAAGLVDYPCVLKPTFLAASRGVIRANNPSEFQAAWRRIEAILSEPDVARRGGTAAREILVEEFLPGDEVALEGLLDGGRLRVLALFDKPDPLDGPYLRGDDLRHALTPRTRRSGAHRIGRGPRRRRAGPLGGAGPCRAPGSRRQGLDPRDRRALDRRALLADLALRHRALARGADPPARAGGARGESDA